MKILAYIKSHKLIFLVVPLLVIAGAGTVLGLSSANTQRTATVQEVAKPEYAEVKNEGKVVISKPSVKVKETAPVTEKKSVAPKVVVEDEPETPPAPKTIDQIAAESTFGVPQYEAFYIRCAHRYDNLIGFKDEFNTTREQAIKNFFMVPGHMEDDVFVLQSNFMSCK